jgi:hypothetical protein
MLRPTLKEMLAGMQRTILESLLPELSSPYAQSQATTTVAMLTVLTNWLDALPAYDAGEIADLRETFNSLHVLIDSEELKRAGLAETAQRAFTAANSAPPDRRAMESAMGQMASALVLKRLAGPGAEIVRGYMRRHLERMRILGGGMIPGA